MLSLRRNAALLTLLLGFTAIAAIAESIPPVHGKTFTGQQVSLPAQLAGRSAVFVLGFTKDSRHQTADWSRQLIATYGDKSNVALYNLLPLDKAPRLMRGFITRAVRNDVSPAARPYFVVLDSHESQWRALVHAADDNAAYIVLCDAAGRVTWQHKGPITSEAFSELQRRLSAPS